MIDEHRKPTVVIGPLAPHRDAKGSRAKKCPVCGHTPEVPPWQPSVALCSSPDMWRVDRLELLCQEEHLELAREVKQEILTVSPRTKVKLRPWLLKDPWDFQEVYSLLHGFARGYPFQQDKEDYFIHITTGTYVMQICLFLLAARRYLPGSLVNTIPPELHKGPIRIIDINLANYEHILEGLKHERLEQTQMLAGSVHWGESFQELLKEIVSASCNCRGPLLLTGPTGSGKSFLARRIHKLKEDRQRVNDKLVEVNCATLDREMASADLFGHVRGGFTGAIRDRKGRIMQAEGGILFLDEVSELGPQAQAKLLTALDTHKFSPVGSDEDKEVDFELITATNRNLREEIRAGRFREDLYHRISALHYELPGLDRRREDIEPFVDFALSDCPAQLYDMRPYMDADARAAFLSYAKNAVWPGNLRQLKQAVLQMAARAEGGRITRREVEGVVAKHTAEEQRNAIGPDEALLVSLVLPEVLETLDNFDRVQLAHVLRVCRSSPTMAAAGRVLFDRSRQQKKSNNDTHRLSLYLQKHHLDWHQVKSAYRSGGPR
jgi:transcriptional regulatory protein RtcR